MLWTNVVLILFVSYFTYINADEYMKREFSLVQPYFGTYKMEWRSIDCMLISFLTVFISFAKRCRHVVTLLGF